MISATTNVILATEEVTTATFKVISATTKVILTTEEVITTTFKIISATTVHGSDLGHLRSDHSNCKGYLSN